MATVINPPAARICQTVCEGDTTTTKLICFEKEKITSFTTFIASCGNNTGTASKSVFVDTSNKDFHLTLDETLPLGCILYVIHEKGCDDLYVDNVVGGSVHVPKRSFMTFIRGNCGWVKSANDSC